jgi:hypothetical protein
MHYGKCPLRSNTEGCGGETWQSDSEDSNSMAPSGRKAYYSPLPVLVLSPGTFGYAFVSNDVCSLCVLGSLLCAAPCQSWLVIEI